MTAAKNVYALMLALVIVLSGCFGMAGNDSDAQDSEENDREQTDDPEDERQARTWFTSGGTYPVEWIDPGMPNDGGYGCIEWGPSYDSESGEYLGEVCRENGYRNSANQWNMSACIDAGGIITWSNAPAGAAENNTTNSAFRYAPDCKIQFATINTSSGEVLLIYQWDAFHLETTCGGVTDYALTYSQIGSKEYYVTTGGAMDCQHNLYLSINYADNFEESEEYRIWSVVYAIQDATVVE